MGNKNSTNTNETNVLPSSDESIKFDKIASNFILSQSSSDIKKLTDLEYCNKLIILTSKIIKNETGGASVPVPVNKEKDKENDTITTNEHKDVSKSSSTQVECDITPDDRAKLYIKVAHLVAAIMTAINPVIYTNDGLVSLFDRHNLESDSEILGIGHYSFCSRRYDSLFKIGESTTKKIINDNICSINDNTRKGLRAFYNGDGSEEINSTPIVKTNNLEVNDDNDKKEYDDSNYKDINVGDIKVGDINKKLNKTEDDYDYDYDSNTNMVNNDDDDDDDGGGGGGGGGGFSNSGTPELYNDAVGKNYEPGSISVPGQYLSASMSVIDKNNVSYKNNMDELGIPELKNLYYDEYDTATNSFRYMSEKSKQRYKTDIKQFYTQFTGNKDTPLEIKSFSDIKLRDYNKHNVCMNNNLSQGNINIDSSLFTKFASNYKNMAETIFTSHSELWNIFKQLIDIDEYTLEDAILNRKDSTVRTSTLFTKSGKTEEDRFEKINQLTDSTRTIIVKMYIECEQSFLEGVQILESLLATVNNETTAGRLSELNNTIGKILSDENI